MTKSNMPTAEKKSERKPAGPLPVKMGVCYISFELPENLKYDPTLEDKLLEEFEGAEYQHSWYNDDCLVLETYDISRTWCETSALKIWSIIEEWRSKNIEE